MSSLRPSHGPRQTWKILSYRFRSWLSYRRYRRKTRRWVIDGSRHVD